MGFLDRLSHAWNAFIGKDKNVVEDFVYRPVNESINYGYMSTYNPFRMHYSKGTERSIITAVYNRIAIDVSNIAIRHVRLDDEGRYLDTIHSGLNNCLELEANKDQAARAFLQDVVESMFDEGVVAITPIDTETDIDKHGITSYDIITMRTGKVIEWYPDYVKLNVYDDRSGRRSDIMMKKENVAIIENPFYAIMNEKNSIMQRLIHKLNILDAIDEQSGSGKLDLIIQLPYVVKTDARKQQARERRREIEDQLSNSKYGIAYTDGTEKITQLNRSVENNLLAQIQYLTSMLYSQFGITQAVLDGTADEKTMLNYTNRTVIPILDSIVGEERRKFLTKTARSQKQDIMYFNNPLKLMPVSNIADIADKFTRNEIMSSNEIRQLIGLKPVNDPKADELRNKNLNPTEGDMPASTEEYGPASTEDYEPSPTDEYEVIVDPNS